LQKESWHGKVQNLEMEKSKKRYELSKQKKLKLGQPIKWTLTFLSF